MSTSVSPLIALSSDVIDQIAAGEVVEKPAHLVKELMENSLDAGATEVTVEVSDGGRSVVVKDDGVGIAGEDLSRALDRHTTSKIRQTDDLWKLSTYGFRGEALASIAAVSMLTMSSRRHDQPQGARITSTYGKKSDVDPVGHAPGTRVQIQNLFENVPARLKFMKSAASEVGAIRNVMKAMALARPEVEFRFLNEGQLDLHLPRASSRRERAEQVLGVKPLYEGRAQRNGVQAFAVMADPGTTAKTSRNIWILAQDRWIQDRALQAAVMDAYRTLLMHGEYPYAVVWVETDPEQIDVNIHPTKSQVKFASPSDAFRAVAASFRETLERAPWTQQILKSNPALRPAVAIPAAHPSFEGGGFERVQYQTKVPLSELASPRVEFAAAGGVKATLERAAMGRDATSAPEITSAGEVEVPVSAGRWASLQILGQADLTYLICQGREGLLFVDQHAAHERVLFEKIMGAWKSGRVDVQDYLFPLHVDLNHEKVEALRGAREDFSRLGVHLEDLGPQTVGVTAAPPWIRESALPKVLDQVATQIVENGGSFRFEAWMADFAATMACHSAVRAGQALSTEEMHSLLKSMDDYPLSSFCPHGRPVSVEYSFAKLEKDFGRTVS